MPLSLEQAIDVEPSAPTVQPKTLSYREAFLLDDMPAEQPAIDVEEAQRQAWQARGKIGFFEAWARADKTELLPFVGSVESAAKSVRTMRAMQRLQEGTGTVEQQGKDREHVETFLLGVEERRTRGYSVFGRIGEVTKEMPAFAVEFLSTGGLASAAKGATKAAAKAVVGEAIERGALRLAAGGIGLAAGATARTATVGVPRLIEQSAERQTMASLTLTERGVQLAERAREQPFTSFMKALGDVWIEYLSEATGPGITAAAQRFMPAPVRSALVRAWKRLKPNEAVERLFTSAGYNGLLAEMGEERVGDFLRALTGVEDFGAEDPHQLFDRLIASWPNGEELMVEAGALAFPGALAVASSQAVEFIRSRKQAANYAEPALQDLSDAQVARLMPVEEAAPSPLEAMPEIQAPEPISESAPPQAIALPVVEMPEPILEAKLSQEVTKAVAEEAASRSESFGLLPSDLAPKRLFRQLADKLQTGELFAENLPTILTKYGLSPAEFAAEYMDTISTSARQLKQLSDLSKTIAEALPEAEEILKPSTQQLDFWTRAATWYRRVDNVRRGLLVTQLATAMRNAESQAGRFALHTIEDTMIGVAQSAQGRRSASAAFERIVTDWQALMRQLTPEGAQRVSRLLDSMPEQAAILLQRPAGEVTLASKAVNALNLLNRVQEFFFRRLAVDAYLTNALLERGLDPARATPEDLPRELLEEAVDYAMRATFAANPASPAGQALLRLYRQVPILTALGNPFPRFWMNSLKFLWDYSPGGLTHLLDAEFRAKLSQGDAEAWRAMARVVVGVGMFSAAVAIRMSDFGGDKWYEVKVGGKQVDLRAFAPFSTYLFFAELMAHPERITGRDWAQALISINRIAGTGLVLIDLMRSDNLESFQRFATDFIGAYVGSFSVPFRTLSDILGSVYPPARLARVDEGILARFLSNLPLAQETLEVAPRLTRAEPFEREGSLVRQFTGLSFKTKTFLESQIDQLGLTGLYPRTGDRKLDRAIVRQMGGLAEQRFRALEQEPAYQRLDRDQRRDFLQERFIEIREQARARLSAQDKQRLRTLRQERK